MLLINLIKRASVNSSVFKSRKYLMLFLLSNTCIFLFLLFQQISFAQNLSIYSEQFNTSLIVEKFVKDSDFKNGLEQTYVNREKKATQSLISQERNFKCLYIFSFVLILLLIIYIIFKRVEFNRFQFEREQELQEALSKLESQKKQLMVSETLFNSCCNTIKNRLKNIIKSLDDVINEFEIEDEKLVNNLNSIREFTTNTLTELSIYYPVKT